MESGILNESTHTVARFRVTLERELRVGPEEARLQTIEQAVEFLTQWYSARSDGLALSPVVELLGLYEAHLSTTQTVVEKAKTLPEAEVVLNQRAEALGVEEVTSEN